MAAMNGIKRIGYLGPEGTFSQQAALEYGKDENSLYVQYPNIPELIYAVASGDIDEAVVPAENALEGTVNVTMDMLVHDVNLKIVGEMVLPISHCLMARPGLTIEEIREVLSHPQALAQCRQFLNHELKGIPCRAVSSTAAAAKMAANPSCYYGAIGSIGAASLYGLEVLKEKIEDNNGNSTRFIVLSRQEKEMNVTGNDKTSIAFTVDHRPGSLYHALKIFADNNINLTKIESRPMKTLLGQYLFLVDFEGHYKEDKIRGILEKLSTNSKYYKFLGSYPKFCNEVKQETVGR
jgi:prephenate dehydratase